MNFTIVVTNFWKPAKHVQNTNTFKTYDIFDLTKMLDCFEYITFRFFIDFSWTISGFQKYYYNIC